MHDKRLIAITVALLACVLIGEAYIYTLDADNNYSVKCSVSATEATIEAYSSISTTYDSLAVYNPTETPIEDYYIYYDGTYTEYLDDVDHATGGKELTQEYCVEQMIHQLTNRGVSAKVYNAEEIRDRLNHDIGDADCGKALIVISGALPDTIYDGNSGSLILDWISAGGCLYWTGNLVGEKISTKEGLVDAPSNYQDLFFGNTCLNSDSKKGYEEIGTNEFRTALSLMSNSIAYSVDVSALPASTEYLQVGYTDGTYSSITFVEHGSGMICVIGGDYSNTQRSDLVQVVASHVNYSSEIIGHAHGNISGTTVTLKMDTDGHVGNINVYTYFGGYYLTYGRCLIANI